MATRSELFDEALGMMRQIKELDATADLAETVRDEAAAALEQTKVEANQGLIEAEKQQNTEEQAAQAAYDLELDAARDRFKVKKDEFTAQISAAAEKAMNAINAANNARNAVSSKQAEIMAKLTEALSAPAE